MPFDVHALMQDAHDPNALRRRQVKNDVRLILKPAQLRREFLGAEPLQGIVRKRLEVLLQTQEIAPRLLQSEIEDRVFVDIYHRDRKRLLLRGYRRPSARSRASTSSMICGTVRSLTPLLKPSSMALFRA